MELSNSEAMTKVHTDVELVENKDASGNVDRALQPKQQQDMRPIRGAGGFLQLKLMMWKHLLSKKRDLSQIAASIIVPLSVFLMMWLFRRKPYQIEADHFFINIALLLQPLAQVASLVTEKQKGLKTLMTTCGLSPAIYTFSWFLSEAISALMLSLVLALFSLSTQILHVNGAVSFFMVWLLLFLYLCASASLAFALSSLFSKPSTAAPITFIIYLGLVFVFLAFSFNVDKKNRAPGCEDEYPTEVTPEALFGSYSYSYDFEYPSDCTELVAQYSDVYPNVCDRPGICMLTCDSCKPNDISDVSGVSEEHQTLLCFIPTFALMFAIMGFDQGSPILRFHIPLQFLCLDVLCYMFIGWYLGEVFPGEAGSPRKPWFLFEPRFLYSIVASFTGCCNGIECQFTSLCRWFWCCCCRWFCSKKDEDSNISPSNDTVNEAATITSQVPESTEPESTEPDFDPVEAVQLLGLRKEFGSHVAVEGLDLNMFEGEIFALLGHNGAGKTTTVSMLTGMLERSDGDALIYGNFLSNGLDDIRQLLGMCPQHDVLFDYLTIGEHIDLFARLKGATLEEMDREREAMLSAFELKHREDFFPVGLSGGMKRKACVALALTGDTRLCILDEPTTGLDPGARRRLWDTLAMLKKGRTILLTTHFMDEAEILGDRVGIMKDGKLACVGSPIALKQEFDIGYELLVRHSGVLPKMNSTDQDSTIESESFNPVFTSEEEPADLTEEQLEELNDKISMKIKSFVLQGISGSSEIPHHPVPNELRFSLPLSSRSSFGPFLTQLQDNSGELCIINFGISMAPFEEVFLKVGNESTIVEGATHATMARRRSSGHIEVGSSDAEKGAEEVEEDHDGAAIIEASGGLLPTDEFYRGVGENIQYTPTFYLQAKGIFIRRLELAFVAMGLDWNQLGVLKYPKDQYTSITANDTESSLFSKLRWPTLSDVKKSPQLLRGIQTWILVLVPLAAAITALYFRIEKKTFYFLIPRTGVSPNEVEAIVPNILVCCIMVAGYLFVPGLLAELLVSEREAKVRNLLAIMGVDPAAYWLGHALGDLLLMAIPVIGTWIAMAAFGLHSFIDGGHGLFFLLHILFILELLSFTYAMSHGFSSTAFAMALLPAISLALLVLPILIMLFTMQFDRMLNDDVKDQISLRVLISILMMTWAALGPHGFFLASTLLLTFPHKYAHDHTKDYLRLFSEHLSPIWAMCLMSVAKTVAFSAGAFYLDFKHLMPLPPPPDPFKDPTPEELAALDSDVAAEFVFVNQNHSTYDHLTAKEVDLDDDDEVIAGGGGGEVVTMLESGVSDDQTKRDEVQAIEYHRLRKVYPNPGVKSGVTVAVQDSNFHVVQGECFGLLGPNGAGKSTTVSMMTRHTPSTRGDVFVMGNSVRQNFTAAARNMGVVTQDNSLYGELDAVTHLSLFARVRGVPEADIPLLVYESLSLMELHPHCRKPSKRLSGGMKRKLCTALSLIGNPPVVAMDEPSSGLDPSSRRNLWKVINETMKRRAVVLTTHLLDEAEALCGRIGIMTHGTMQCIGSALHLRNKFGKGYQVVLTTKEMGSSPARDQSFAKVNSFVAHLFDDKAELANRHSRMLTYRVPAENMRIAEAFTKLEESMEELNLDSYVICQPTLEQVFLGFTVEKDREHSHLTNEAEQRLASAFDDTDVRIADAAKSRCCWIERPQHTKNFWRSCLLCPIVFFTFIFTWQDLFNAITNIVDGGKTVIWQLPLSEKRHRPRCNGRNNTLPDLTGSYAESITHYAVFNASDNIDVCKGVQVPFTLNPNWRLTNFTMSIGVSGDLDAKSGFVPYFGFDDDDDDDNGDTDDDIWDSTDIWDETVKIYFKSGLSINSLENYNYDDWYHNGEDRGYFLGQCGGCPRRIGDWSWAGSYKTDMIKTCGDRNSSQGYTITEGRCQLDCNNNPYYETCLPSVSTYRNEFDSWEVFKSSAKNYPIPYIFKHKEDGNNFTISIEVNNGVNVESCKSGLRFKINIGLNYDCDGGIALCSSNSSLGYDYSDTSGQTVTNTNSSQCYIKKRHKLAYDNIYVTISVFVFFELSIIILCCICVGAACGICCTKTPEDDSNDTLTSKKKGKNWFGRKNRNVVSEDSDVGDSD